MPGFPSAMLYAAATARGIRSELDIGTIQLTAAIEAAALAAFGAAFYLENKKEINHELLKFAGDVKTKINNYL